MAEVTAALVRELREKTGAGMMDCKRALGDSNGDIEAAVDWLRKKGLSAAATCIASCFPSSPSFSAGAVEARVTSTPIFPIPGPSELWT